MATRFLLGFFEAAAIPLFSVITISFYRRSEQPLRVAAWYSTNGLANLLCSPIVYGLARVHSSKLHTYQIVYLFFGAISLAAGISSYFLLSDSPGEAKYLKEEDRAKAVERLKANQQGIVSHKVRQDTLIASISRLTCSFFQFNIKHVFEAFTESKFYLFMLMSIATNIGAATSSVFGALLTLVSRHMWFWLTYAIHRPHYHPATGWLHSRQSCSPKYPLRLPSIRSHHSGFVASHALQAQGTHLGYLHYADYCRSRHALRSGKD